MNSAMQIMNAMRASMTSMVMDNGATTGLQTQTEPAALRMQEAILRSQAEAALRLAVSQAVQQQQQQQQQTQDSRAGYPAPQTPNQAQNGPMTPNQSQDISEALRLQDQQRLEQALRLHGGDPRALAFNLPTPTNQHINP